MKKALGLASAVLMTVALTSCSDGGDDNTSASTPSSETSASTTQSPETSAPTTPETSAPTTPETSAPSTAPTTQPSEPPTSDYCKTLKQSQAQFDDLDISTLDEAQFKQLTDRFDLLEEQAPAKVADDWATIGDQLDDFKNLLDQAGIGLDDLKTLQKGKLPKGVDPAKIQALAPKMQELAENSGLEDAKQVIEENAESECNISLGD